jgi:hypothetical protein
MRQYVTVLLFLAMAAAGFAQGVTDTRTAEIRGGGGGGKCTVEVDVDDVAEVEISGNRAQIRTYAGGPARIVRFVCNQAMPAIPYEFRFEGVDGRGRQTLIREPGRGPAVIRIEDPKGGREGYTFDIFWRGATGVRPGGGFGRPGYGDRNDGGGGWNRELNFRGRGDGEYRSSRGPADRLYDCRVSIRRNGEVEVRFDTDRAYSLVLAGRVLRIEQDRIYAAMSGNGINGEMTIEVEGRDRISGIYMAGRGRDRFEIRWRN